ncbi:MAG: DUF2934 domain-containing protein [Blastocatellia bacterium]
MRDKKKYDRSMDEMSEARDSSSMMMMDEQAFEMDCGQMDLREMIARRAYEIYEERGRCDGDDMNDWLRAEAEVKSALMTGMQHSMVSRASV